MRIIIKKQADKISLEDENAMRDKKVSQYEKMNDTIKIHSG